MGQKCTDIRFFLQCRCSKCKVHLQYYQQELGYWKRILLQFPRYLFSKFLILLLCMAKMGQNAILQIKCTQIVSLIAFGSSSHLNEYVLHPYDKILYCIIELDILRESDTTRDSRLQVFSPNKFLPGSWVSYWSHFDFFSKICVDICNFVYTTSVVNTASNLFTYDSETRDILLLVALLLAINSCRCHWHRLLSLVLDFHRFHDTGT